MSIDESKATSVLACTIVDPNYLSYAKTLCKSFEKHHPDIQLYVFLLNSSVEEHGRDVEDLRIIPVDDILFENKNELFFKYNVTELSTAIKPTCLKHLLTRFQPKTVIYLDPDLFFYSRMNSVLEKLNDHNAILTPHLLSPIGEDGLSPSEIEIMGVGCYNLGFAAFRNSGETREFLSWWEERLRDNSVMAPDHGLFTDQKWMDLCPSFLQDVYVLRDYGYNTAYWNLHERQNFSKKQEHYFINGRPLVFFHFSGLLIDNINQISKFQNRFNLLQFNTVLKEMFHAYKEELINNGILGKTHFASNYSHFDNNMKIPDIVRKIYYYQENKQQFGNPFSTNTKNCFLTWLLAPADRNKKVTNLLAEIYRMRTDLLKSFTDISGDENKLINWALSTLESEYQVSKDYYPNLFEGESMAGKMRRTFFNQTEKLSKSKFKYVIMSRIGYKSYCWLKEKYYSIKYANSK